MRFLILTGVLGVWFQSAFAQGNELGNLFSEYDLAAKTCSENDYDHRSCEKKNSLRRQLVNSGWCREFGRKENIFHRCETYRSYIVSPELEGFQFGFERSGRDFNFSSALTADTPSIDGNLEKEIVGWLHIQCTPGQLAQVALDMKASYPDFSDRPDKNNIGVFSRGDGGSRVSGIEIEESEGNVRLLFASNEIVLNMLEYFRVGFDFKDHFSLEFFSMDPEVSLNFIFSPLIFNVTVATRNQEFVGQVNDMITVCRAS